MTKQFFFDMTKTDIIIDASENQLRTNGADTRIGEGRNNIPYQWAHFKLSQHLSIF